MSLSGQAQCDVQTQLQAVITLKPKCVKAVKCKLTSCHLVFSVTASHIRWKHQFFRIMRLIALNWWVNYWTIIIHGCSIMWLPYRHVLLLSNRWGKYTEITLNEGWKMQHYTFLLYYLLTQSCYSIIKHQSEKSLCN